MGSLILSDEALTLTIDPGGKITKTLILAEVADFKGTGVLSGIARASF